ncbi:MAG: hypothetical protein H0W76_06365 [Pyrinomonadaceae bacterium]|nr:hypothetical protein [Pyrinomonadaceae bacterium]
MFNKLIALIVASALIGLVVVKPVSANSKEAKQSRMAAKVKEGIGRLGTGEAARVEVKLRDKKKLKGYISEAGENTFVVVDARYGPTTVAYPQVKQVRGHNLSTGAKVAIGLGIAVAVLVFLLVLENYG